MRRRSLRADRFCRFYSVLLSLKGLRTGGPAYLAIYATSQNYFYRLCVFAFQNLGREDNGRMRVSSVSTFILSIPLLYASLLNF